MPKKTGPPAEANDPVLNKARIDLKRPKS